MYLIPQLLLYTAYLLALDDNLITEGPEGGQYGFFIHPGETVQLPFKYQSFSAPLATKLNEEKKTIKVNLCYFAHLKHLYRN